MGNRFMNQIEAIVVDIISISILVENQVGQPFDL